MVGRSRVAHRADRTRAEIWKARFRWQSAQGRLAARSAGGGIEGVSAGPRPPNLPAARVRRQMDGSGWGEAGQPPATARAAATAANRRRSWLKPAIA